MAYESYSSAGKTIEIESDDSSITVYVSGFSTVNYDRIFYIKYKKSSQSTSNYAVIDYMEVPGGKDPDDPWEAYQKDLKADTTYSIKITVFNNENYEVVWEWEKTSAISTDPKIPIPTIEKIDTSRGRSDVRVYWDVDSHTSGTIYTIYVKEKGGSYYNKLSTTKVPSSGYSSIEVDKYKTIYYIYIEADYDGMIEESGTKTFEVDLIIPDTWIWTLSERDAFNNKGLVSTITQTRWNNFISWARDVIAYINDRDSVSNNQIPNNANMKDDKILYADSWNAIDYYSRKACKDSTHIDRSSGDIVKGEYFIDLTDILNGEI